MQRQKKIIFVLTAILLFALLAPTAAFAALTGTTTASVEFEDGLIEMQDPDEGNGMDIDFGRQKLPAGEAEYPSTNGPHTLRVADARNTSTAWKMNVAATAFTTDDPASPTEFLATIELTKKIPDGIVDPICTEPVDIVSGLPMTLVLDASDALGRGTFDTTWASEDVLLKISKDDYEDVQIATYEATLTWTLEIGA